VEVAQLLGEREEDRDELRDEVAQIEGVDVVESIAIIETRGEFDELTQDVSDAKLEKEDAIVMLWLGEIDNESVMLVEVESDRVAVATADANIDCVDDTE